MFLQVLLCQYHLSKGQPSNIAAIIARLAELNLHSLDCLQATCYFFYSREKERQGCLPEIRNELLKHYSRACVRKDEAGQSTLLTLLLRNYYVTKEYESAYHLIDKSQFPEHCSAAQYCRFLYYDGFISAVRADYAKARTSLTQAFRKAPQNSGKGFKTQCLKAGVVAQLLLGEIPAREQFSLPQFQAQLLPYFKLTQAVLKGSLGQFQQVLEQNANKFQEDKVLLLVRRMHHLVLKIGLRKINAAYSKISLKDIEQKLGLAEADVVLVVAKAIQDKVIDGLLDLEAGHLIVHQKKNQYSTPEPFKAFARRIQFCLNLHQSAQRAIIHSAEVPLPRVDEDAGDETSSMAELLDYEDEI